MVRTALEYVKRRFSVARPLIEESFQTDGESLFVEKYGELINASRGGQTTVGTLLMAQLDRIETRQTRQTYPSLSFHSCCRYRRQSDRPAETRVDESPRLVRAAFGLSREQIEEAIRCEAA